MRKTTVLIADDETLVRSGLRMICESCSTLEVVASAENGVQAVELVEKLQPDVALVDIRMPEMDGVEATKKIATAGHHTRVLILTTFDLDEYAFAALKSGASGFLLKDVHPTELINAIRIIARGDALLAPSLTRRLLDRFTDALPGQLKSTVNSQQRLDEYGYRVTKNTKDTRT